MATFKDAKKKGPLPPELTDQQIIETFTDAERRFYEWEQKGNSIRKFGFGNMEKGLRAEFPGVNNVQDQYRVFMDKWGGRFRRRWALPVPVVDVLKIIKETNCRNPNSVLSTVLTLQTRRVPDLLLGESSFGGHLAGYAIAIDPSFLQPDPSNHDEQNSPADMFLNSAVISIDPNSPRPTVQPQFWQLPSSPEKRRRENRSSGEDSATSQRSTTSDDFMDADPHVFFQLGELVASVGYDWLAARVHPSGEAAKRAEWKSTGYSVLVKLNKSGHPTGPVFVAYAFCRLEDGNAKEMDWSDKYRREMPFVRRLHEDCKDRFYFAQIANKLEDLRYGTKFGFDVKCENRCTVQGAKVVGFGSSEKVVPRKVSDNAGEDKRAKVASFW
ncbi:unnamed protein product [Clonostachys rosea]|uniref:Uncharacterized protein n=1 Tax=Bionectria ochroleuca TaxID=29856 RepID=A0ABY6TYK2_BIOOC|nr:unnamed protein product [Clonostachys rosea]